MEVDLSAGTQLVYMFPDMVLSIDNFHNHVEVAIQTHGYDTWQGGESNLLVTMVMIDRLSNTSYMGFQYSVDNVVDHLTIAGITAIPGERRSVEELEGMSWNLKPSEQTLVRVPSRVAVNESLNRSLSLQFERYRRAPQLARYSVDQHDREILDKEVTPCKVTILDEKDVWDDDERSEGKILVLQEQLSQNQQDFLNEYLPKWDDQLAIQKQKSKMEWENPFAAKRAQIINKHEEHAFPTATNDEESSTRYQPPPDAIIGPTVYPLIRQNPQPTYKPDYQFGYPKRKGNIFNRGYGAYSALETITDDPQNITSQVRQLIIMEDPYRGSTDEQDRAYRDLDKITCEETKNLWSFLEDFRQLAIKSGKLYFPSTTEKLFAKLPPYLSKKIKESFKAKHPGLSAGVLPAIRFTHNFISEMCKDAALAKELRDLSLCSSIPIPGYYKNNKKKYGIRKSRTYKGKPYNSHEGHFVKDCRSKQGNIARSDIYQELDLDDNWDIVSADFDDSNVYSISEGEGDVHQNIEEDYDSHHAFMFHPGPPTKIADMVQSAGSWIPDKELPTQSKGCEHDWKENTVTNYTICYYCRILTIDMSRLNCPKCQLTTCALCARNYLGKIVNVKGKQPHKLEEGKYFSSNEEELWKLEKSLLLNDLTDALKIIDQLKIEQVSLEEQKDEEIRKLKAELQKEKEA
ncbi:hypothetical protein Tco_1001767 [Tanacetum coccineum]